MASEMSLILFGWWWICGSLRKVGRMVGQVFGQQLRLIRQLVHWLVCGLAGDWLARKSI